MHFKPNIDKLIENTAISIVLASFLFMISGCGYYRPVTIVNKHPDAFFGEMMDELYPEKKYSREYYPESNLKKMLFMEHQFYVIDSTGTWALNNPTLKGDTIYAQAMEYSLPLNDNPDDKHYLHDKKYDPVADKAILKGIKLYVESLHFRNNDTAFIPFTSVKQYDIYEKDNSRDVGLALALVGGTLVASLVIAIAVAIENAETDYSMSSCPFIYTHDGNDWQFDGEIFSGAIFRSLERDDYLALNKYDATPGGNYRIKMANMLEEIQYINQADLVVVNHDSNVRVLVDKYGKVQTVKAPVLPYAAIDSRGNDCRGQLSVTDQVTYDFDENPDTANHCLNSLALSFRSDSNPDSCKILVTGHNSLWIDHIVRRILERLGGNYPIWARIMDSKPAGEQKAWVLSQGLPLQVYLQKGQEWQLADYFDIVGPMESRELVLPLDARDAWKADTTGGIPSYTLNVRLVTGFDFWALDFAAMDFSENAPVEITYLGPDQVTDQDGKDVTGLLAGDDRKYLVQRETGNEAIMEFKLPINMTSASTFFLHSKGYYHQAIERNGHSELAFIWDFLNPGRLSEWSYEKYSIFQNLITEKNNEK
jgi:hypothetical protein